MDGQQFDIVIIGGGLAGNCLALALKDSGLSIAILESHNKEQLTHSPLGDRALALASGTVATLTEMGVWQAIASSATPIKTIHVSDRGHFGKVRLSAAKENVEALGYVITARDIESHVNECVEQSQISLIRPARLLGFSAGQDKVNISLKYHDESICISAKLLVGADGGQSSVRKLLGIEQETTDYGQTALVTTVKSSLPHLNTAFERFTSSGPLALLPCGKNLSAVIWTRSHEEADSLIKGSEDDFLAELQACFGYRLGRLTLAAPRRAFPVTLVKAARMWSNRCILIGNAAHQLHPVAGQGFNLGLRDVIHLANMLTATHKLGEDIAAESFLAQYAGLREKDHRYTIGFTDTLVRLFSNNYPPITAARNIGMTLFDLLPKAKSILSLHAMGLAQKLDT